MIFIRNKPYHKTQIPLPQRLLGLAHILFLAKTTGHQIDHLQKKMLLQTNRASVQVKVFYWYIESFKNQSLVSVKVLQTRASVQVTGVIILYRRFVTVEMNPEP